MQSLHFGTHRAGAHALSLIAAFLLLLSLMGCGSPAGSVVGAWDVEGMAAVVPDIESVKATFQEGGAMTMVFVSSRSLPGGAGNLKLEMTAVGTYSLEGENMTLRFEDLGMETLEVPEAMRAMLEQQMAAAFSEDMKRTTLEAMNQGGTGQVKWSGADRFSIQFDGRETSFVRVAAE